MNFFSYIEPTAPTAIPTATVISTATEISTETAISMATAISTDITIPTAIQVKTLAIFFFQWILSMVKYKHDFLCWLQIIGNKI